MNKNNIVLLSIAILLFVFSIIFVFLSFSENNPKTSNNLANNTTPVEDTPITEEDFFNNINYDDFVDFKFSDKDNKELKMSSYLEKPIAIFFSDFKGNPEDSNNFKLIFELYYEDYKEDIQFFCIDKNDVPEYISEIKLYKDIDGIEKYSIEKLPTFIFIDSEGNVINQVTEITEDSMEANLDLITGNY